MKTDIHPKYQQVTFTCACGATYTAGSTIKGDFKSDLCSNCHPFYTGKQKLVDSSGRVDKFYAKVKKAQEKAEKEVKKTKGKKITDLKEMETQDEVETSEETEKEAA